MAKKRQNQPSFQEIVDELFISVASRKHIRSRAGEISDALSVATQDDAERVARLLLSMSNPPGARGLAFLFKDYEPAVVAIRTSIFAISTPENAKTLLRLCATPGELADAGVMTHLESASFFLARAAELAPKDSFLAFSSEILKSFEVRGALEYLPTFLSRFVAEIAGPPGNISCKEASLPGISERMAKVLARASSFEMMETSDVPHPGRAISMLPPLCSDPDIAESVLLLAVSMGGPVFDISRVVPNPDFIQSVAWPVDTRIQSLPEPLLKSSPSLVDFALFQGSHETAGKFVSLGVPFDRGAFFEAVSLVRGLWIDGAGERASMAEQAFLKMAAETPKTSKSGPRSV